jgi:PPOX class probable F420-dependent enzyme
MGVRLSAEEAWEFLGGAHTGILTTLRSDGSPVSLPTWFVVGDGVVYVRTQPRAKKVRRLERDPRVSFVAESGLHWAELKAVVVSGRASVLGEGAERDRVVAEFDRKYRGFRVERARMPEATKRHYAGGSVVIRIDPEGPLVTWDNAKLRLRD